MPQILSEWLSKLETLHKQAIDLGLERCAEVARRLSLIGDPSVHPIAGRWLHRATVITVAGTNGKGSCVAMLSTLLRASGASVGCYTSPHIVRFNERIVINGNEVSDQELCEIFSEIDEARENISLSYFEFSTLAALLLFKKHDVDYCVLEVGLGGRLDATNIVDTDLAIITSIDIDHQDWLGNDREQIAIEKAGIVRPGKPLVCAEDSPPKSLLAIINDHTPSYTVGEHFYLRQQSDRFELKILGERFMLDSLTLPTPSVAAACFAASRFIDLSELPLSTLVSECRLAGRMQVFRRHGKRVILDVAHNPASTSLLAEQLASYEKPIAIVFAIMSDKDILASVEPLAPIVDGWYLGQLDLERALKPVDLKGVLETVTYEKVLCFENVEKAYRAALNGPYETVVVAGSFYTVSEVSVLLEQENG